MICLVLFRKFTLLIILPVVQKKNLTNKSYFLIEKNGLSYTDVENEHMDTKGGKWGGGDELGDWD